MKRRFRAFKRRHARWKGRRGRRARRKGKTAGKVKRWSRAAKQPKEVKTALTTFRTKNKVRKSSEFNSAQWKLLHSRTAAEEYAGRDDAVPLTTTNQSNATTSSGATAASTGKVDLDEDGFVQGHFIADDMLIRPHVKEHFDREGLDHLVQEGTKAVKATWRWPNAVVDYKFDKNFNFTKQVKAAMKTFEALTPLRFYEMNETEMKAANVTINDYIVFKQNNTDGCWSYVGHTGGAQGLNLGNGCEDEGTIMHELGHTIGLIHEQARADRNQYVHVDMNNVSPGAAENFQKCNKISNGENLHVEYDFESLMHYGPFAFSKNGKATITVNQNCSGHKIGRRSEWCAGDMEQMVDMYTDNATIKALYKPVWEAKKAVEAEKYKLDKAGCKDTDELCPLYVKEYGCEEELDGGKTVALLCPFACHTDKVKCAAYSAYNATNTAYQAAIVALSGPAADAAVLAVAQESKRRKDAKLKKLQEEMTGKVCADKKTECATWLKKYSAAIATDGCENVQVTSGTETKYMDQWCEKTCQYC